MFDRELPPFQSLVGSFLIAMPEMEDKRFHHTLIYITHHTQTEGASGLIINQPTDKITCLEILEQLKMPHLGNVIFPKILVGGPDHKMQGFILHTPEVNFPETQKITETVSLTTTQEILGEIAQGHRPDKYLVAVGCASWAPSQMEEEIMGNLWLNTPANNEILFDIPYDQKWGKAMNLLGINPNHFSPKAGKA